MCSCDICAEARKSLSPAMLERIEIDGGARFHYERKRMIEEFMEQQTEQFTIKDSGSRAGIGEGVRDTEEGKTDYTLILDGVMYDRWAEHMTKGGRKYTARNWLKFFATRESARAAYDRAGRSLARHYKDYMRGIRDEDHASAVFFNIDVRETALKIYPDLLNDGTPAAPKVSA